MRSATSPGVTPRARSSSRCDSSPKDAVTDRRHPAPSPRSRRWPSTARYSHPAQKPPPRGHHHGRCQPGPRTTSAPPLVARRASSDRATWRSDEDRQAPRPATGGDLEHTGQGSTARNRRGLPIDRITLSDKQPGENAHSSAVLYGSVGRVTSPGKDADGTFGAVSAGTGAVAGARSAERIRPRAGPGLRGLQACRWTAGGGCPQTEVVPATSYARSGEVNIAYQVFGDGPLDLVFVPGFISHIELAWEEPYLASVSAAACCFHPGDLLRQAGHGAVGSGLAAAWPGRANGRHPGRDGCGRLAAGCPVRRLRRRVPVHPHGGIRLSRAGHGELRPARDREFAAFLAGISDSALTFRNLDVLREEDL
jgi:hypothetical protein